MIGNFLVLKDIRRSIKLWDIQGPGGSERTFMHDFVVY